MSDAKVTGTIDLAPRKDLGLTGRRDQGVVRRRPRVDLNWSE